MYESAVLNLGELGLETSPDGHMSVAFRGRVYRLYGGPYRNKPPSMIGIKMAAEIPLYCAIDIPTQDFSTPDPVVLRAGLLETFRMMNSLNYHHSQQRYYVGCMGGIGRTGLFMAAFAKMLGVRDPIGCVRSQYKRHAVETTKQLVFIDRLRVDDLYRRCTVIAMQARYGAFLGAAIGNTALWLEGK